MAARIAATMGMLAFALCVTIGLVVGNKFETTILRALGAMIVTLLVGFMVGGMAQKMLDERTQSAKKTQFTEAKPLPRDR